MIVELAMIALIVLFVAATPVIFPSLMIQMISHILVNRPDDYEGWV